MYIAHEICKGSTHTHTKPLMKEIKEELNNAE